MNNGNSPAYPSTVTVQPENQHAYEASYKGFTKRELFAAMAMQGLLASNEDHLDIAGLFDGEAVIPELAVGYADALLAELGKAKENA